MATLGLAVGLCAFPVRHLRRMAAQTAMLIVSGSTAIAASLWWAGEVPHGGHGNPNWLGLVLAVALPIVADRAMSSSGRERRWCVVALGIGALGLALSHSRSAWLGTALASIVMVRGRKRWVLAAAGIALTALVVWCTDVGAALEGRLWIWRAALSAAGERPVVGHGIGRFAFSFLDAQGQLLAPLPLPVASVRFVNAENAHNDALQLLVEGGAVACLGVAVALVTALVQLNRRWRGGLGALIALAVAGGADVTLLQPAVLVLVALVFAGCPRLRWQKHDNLFAVALVGGLAMLLLISTRAWIAEHLLAQARQLPFADRASRLERAQLVDRDAGTVTFELGLTHLASGQPRKAVDDFERSRLTFANVGTDVALGNAWIAIGLPDRAVPAFRRALRWQPARFAAQLNLCEAARLSGDLALAEQHLRQAEQLQPHHAKLAVIRERLRRATIDTATDE
jgi:tetratricopeptide (TPR) repeat protein